MAGIKKYQVCVEVSLKDRVFFCAKSFRELLLKQRGTFSKNGAHLIILVGDQLSASAARRAVKGAGQRAAGCLRSAH
jgi:hypothetical protein